MLKHACILGINPILLKQEAGSLETQKPCQQQTGEGQALRQGLRAVKLESLKQEAMEVDSAALEPGSYIRGSR